MEACTNEKQWLYSQGFPFLLLDLVRSFSPCPWDPMNVSGMRFVLATRLCAHALIAAISFSPRWYASLFHNGHDSPFPRASAWPPFTFGQLIRWRPRASVLKGKRLTCAVPGFQRESIVTESEIRTSIFRTDRRRHKPFWVESIIGGKANFAPWVAVIVSLTVPCYSLYQRLILNCWHTYENNIILIFNLSILFVVTDNIHICHFDYRQFALRIFARVHECVCACVCGGGGVRWRFFGFAFVVDRFFSSSFL